MQCLRYRLRRNIALNNVVIALSQAADVAVCSVLILLLGRAEVFRKGMGREDNLSRNQQQNSDQRP